MTKKYEIILEEILNEIIPSKKELEFMKNRLNLFVIKINKRIKKLKLNAELFVGGSFAKNTIVKKGNYDVDLFLRFNSKYKDDDLSRLTKKILFTTKNVSRVHGSRDYFKIKVAPNFFFEVVPVRKIKNAKEAENITDLSYSHVKYINKKVKSKELSKEIVLAKAFCYATKTYGAESYINGFSGYSLELLICHYGSFIKMLGELSKKREDKIIIDMEKLYKKKQDILLDLNEAKLSSPIILIDPTFKQRNVLAALNDETFERFKIAAKLFLKSPTKEMFFLKPIRLENLKRQAIKIKNEFLLISIKTKKQEGDIAGTKLLKFHKHLKQELKKFFYITDSGFDYGGKKTGRSYFILKKKGEIIFPGPKFSDKKNLEIFKTKHKGVFRKGSKVYAREKFYLSSKDFLKTWIKINKKKIKSMSISGIKIIDSL